MKTPLPQAKEARGLTNWVTASLREAILNGHFSPGEKLDQDLIASELNVSRTPIREALKVLESEGLIQIRSYRGAYISSLNWQDIRDVFEARRIIETEVIRQAAPVIPREVLDRLVDINQQEKSELENNPTGQKDKTDQEFHKTISQYSQNRLFIELLEKLNNRLERLGGFIWNQPVPFLMRTNEEHRLILAAMRQGDSEKAAQLMEQHLRNSGLRIEELMN